MGLGDTPPPVKKNARQRGKQIFEGPWTKKSIVFQILLRLLAQLQGHACRIKLLNVSFSSFVKPSISFGYNMTNAWLHKLIWASFVQFKFKFLMGGKPFSSAQILTSTALSTLFVVGLLFLFLFEFEFEEKSEEEGRGIEWPAEGLYAGFGRFRILCILLTQKNKIKDARMFLLFFFKKLFRRNFQPHFCFKRNALIQYIFHPAKFHSHAKCHLKIAWSCKNIAVKNLKKYVLHEYFFLY